MTGLAIAASSEGSLGALLGGVPSSTSAPPVAGAIAFLDLLGWLGDPSSGDDYAGMEAAPEWAVESAPPLVSSPIMSCPVPQAAPQQIAAAVIRSMLRPSVVLAPVEVEITREVTNAGPNEQDDWDVPLDWTAPEERSWEDEEDQGSETVVLEVQQGTVVFAPPAVSIPLLKPVLEPGPALHAVLPDTAAPATLPGPVEQEVTVVGERTKIVAPMPGPEAAAPLAFAMRLSSTASASGVGALEGAAGPLLAAEAHQPEVDQAVESQPEIHHIAAEVPQPVQREFPAEGLGKASRVENGPPVVQTGKVEPAPAAGREQPVPMDPQRVPNEKPSGKNEAEAEDRKPSVAPSSRMKASKVAPTRVDFPGQESAAVVHTGVARHSPPASQTLPQTTTPSVEGPQTIAEPAIAPPRTGTSHEIAVRVSSPDTAPVDLQVRERGGAVHVAVRTADGTMQTALRQDLGVLMDRLEQTGFRTEAVVTQDSGPRVETGMNLADGFRVHSSEANAASQSETPHERDSSGAHEQNPGGRQQNPQRRQNQAQHQNQAQQQKWLQSMLAQRMENQA